MNTIFISIGIVLVGFLIFLFLIFKARRKARAIVHYESIRDKLTLREEEEAEEIVNEALGGFSLGNLISGFIVILIGVNLIPEIMKQVGLTCDGSTVANITSVSNEVLCQGAAGTIVNLIPIFFVITLITLAISLTLRGLKGAGLM